MQTDPLGIIARNGLAEADRADTRLRERRRAARGFKHLPRLRRAISLEKQHQQDRQHQGDAGGGCESADEGHAHASLHIACPFIGWLRKGDRRDLAHARPGQAGEFDTAGV